MPTPASGRSSRAGLTLVELLTVIAIISILISILIPTVSTVRTGARRAKAKVHLTQWATSIEMFRQEYGFYPAFSFNTDGLIDTAAESDEFFETLSSSKPDGTQSATAPAGNDKRIAFYTFSRSELDESDRVVDEFESDLIGMLVDKNYDGIIKVKTGTADEDYALFPDIGFGTANAPPDWPTDGLRAGVAIYSPGPGGSLDKAITTW